MNSNDKGLKGPSEDDDGEEKSSERSSLESGQNYDHMDIDSKTNKTCSQMPTKARSKGSSSRH